MYRIVIARRGLDIMRFSSTSHAEMDAGCVQRLLGQKNERLQLCRERFQGEHRGSLRNGRQPGSRKRRENLRKSREGRPRGASSGWLISR